MHPPTEPAPPFINTLKEELTRLLTRQDEIETEIARLQAEQSTNTHDIEALTQLLTSRGHQDELSPGTPRNAQPSTTSARPTVVTTRAAILKLLASEDRDFTIKEIIERAHNYGSPARETTIRSAIVHMAKAHQIQKGNHRGTWRTPTNTPASTVPATIDATED